MRDQDVLKKAFERQEELGLYRRLTNSGYESTSPRQNFAQRDFGSVVGKDPELERTRKKLEDHKLQAQRKEDEQLVKKDEATIRLRDKRFSSTREEDYYHHRIGNVRNESSSEDESSQYDLRKFGLGDLSSVDSSDSEDFAKKRRGTVRGLTSQYITKPRSHSRHGHRDISRSRSRSRSFSSSILAATATRRFISGVEERREKTLTGRSRTRSVSRRGRYRSTDDVVEIVGGEGFPLSRRYYSDDDLFAQNPGNYIPKHRERTMAKAAAEADVAADGIEEVHRKSPRRPRSQATSLAGAAIAGLYEARRARQDTTDKAPRDRSYSPSSRSRSRSRVRYPVNSAFPDYSTPTKATEDTRISRSPAIPVNPSASLVPTPWWRREGGELDSQEGYASRVLDEGKGKQRPSSWDSITRARGSPPSPTRDELYYDTPPPPPTYVPKEPANVRRVSGRSQHGPPPQP
jgi:hypothetical protein